MAINSSVELTNAQLLSTSFSLACAIFQVKSKPLASTSALTGQIRSVSGVVSNWLSRDSVGCCLAAEHMIDPIQERE